MLLIKNIKAIVKLDVAAPTKILPIIRDNILVAIVKVIQITFFLKSFKEY